MTTWTPPSRLPSRDELQPQRTARAATGTTPTVRQQYDLTAVIGVLVLAAEQQHRGVSQRSHEFTPPTTRPSPPPRRAYKRRHDLADARHWLWKILRPLRPLRYPGAGAPGPDPGRLAEKNSSRGSHQPEGAHEQRSGRGGNRLIQKLKRIGHGFRNLADYRLGLLLAVGLDWRTYTGKPPQPPRTRGRSPRLVA